MAPGKRRSGQQRPSAQKARYSHQPLHVDRLNDDLMLAILKLIKPLNCLLKLRLVSRNFSRLVLDTVRLNTTAFDTDSVFKPRRRAYNLSQLRLERVLEFLVKNCSLLQEIRLHGRVCPSDERMLDHKASEKTLKKLELPEQLIGRFLSSMTQLTSVSIVGFFVKSNTAQHFELDHLRAKMPLDSVNQQLMAGLSKLTSLQTFRFSANQVCAGEMLDGLPDALQVLMLDDAVFSSQHLIQFLCRAQRLHTLSLAGGQLKQFVKGCGLNGDVCTAIASLVTLRTLDLSNTRRHPSGLVSAESFAQMFSTIPSRLTSINLNYNGFCKPKMFPVLAAQSSLERLHLEDHRGREEDLRLLLSLHRLQELSVRVPIWPGANRQLSKTTAAFLSAACDSFPRLRVLRLGWIHHLQSPDQLRQLCRLPNVVDLEFGVPSHMLSKEVFLDLAIGLPKLMMFECQLRGRTAPDIDDAALLQFATASPNMSRFVLLGRLDVSDAAVRQISASGSWPNLKQFWMDGSKVTREGYGLFGNLIPVVF